MQTWTGHVHAASGFFPTWGGHAGQLLQILSDFSVIIAFFSVNLTHSAGIPLRFLVSCGG